MTAIAWADVIAVAPELSTVAVELQNFLTDYVNGFRVSTMLATSDSLVRTLLAAHVATVITMKKAGPVTSQSEGGVSQGWANLATTPWSWSPYGRSLSFLCRLTGAVGGMTA